MLYIALQASSSQKDYWFARQQPTSEGFDVQGSLSATIDTQGASKLVLHAAPLPILPALPQRCGDVDQSHVPALPERLAL